MYAFVVAEALQLAVLGRSTVETTVPFLDVIPFGLLGFQSLRDCFRANIGTIGLQCLLSVCTRQRGASARAGMTDLAFRMWVCMYACAC
jgi:hypothetical protein